MYLSVGTSRTPCTRRQGAWRLRGLGRGQRLVVCLVSEVATLAAATVAELLGQAGATPAVLQAQAEALSPLTVCTWLLCNALRFEALQASARGL